MNPSPRICILSFSKIAWDSRVLREIHYALPHYQVDVIGFGDWTPPDGVRFFPVAKTQRGKSYMINYLSALVAGRVASSVYERFFWGKAEYSAALEILLREKYDLIHANDWDSLPVAVTAARKTGSKVLFDAHEYTVEQEADRPFWKATVAPFRDRMIRSYQESIQARITVAEGIRQLYKTNYGWDMDLILNAPKYNPIPYRPVNPEQINIIHHGGALPTRYIEDFVDLSTALDSRFCLTLMLMPTNPGYYARLRRKASALVCDRLRFIEPVPPPKIPETLRQYDLGIPAMRVGQLNNFYCLPNKFFEFLMNGLAVITTPLPSMQQLIAAHKIGAVAANQTWQSVANCINQLTPAQINTFKQNSLVLAQQINADTEGQKLLAIYERILH
ncbi:MAG TPA: glycosyltransferase [Anaerolineales bacterium]|nr:glycosyltransferase [Anaerolineales bacterium]